VFDEAFLPRYRLVQRYERRASSQKNFSCRRAPAPASFGTRAPADLITAGKARSGCEIGFPIGKRNRLLNRLQKGGLLWERRGSETVPAPKFLPSSLDAP